MNFSENCKSKEQKIKKRKPLRLTEIENDKNEEVKFLEILAALLDKNEIEKEKETESDAVDGITDSILSRAEKLTELLECDFDSLGFPRTVIKVLKKLKAIIDFFSAKKTLSEFKNL